MTTTIKEKDLDLDHTRKKEGNSSYLVAPMIDIERTRKNMIIKKVNMTDDIINFIIILTIQLVNFILLNILKSIYVSI